MSKIILDLCGGTGAWSKYYQQAGYEVRIITLPKNDIRNYAPPENVYGILAAPPCTMFSFARTNAKKKRDLKEGMECVRACLDIIWRVQEIVQETGKKTLPLKFWALENPAHGFLKHFLGPPVFIFDPLEFGDRYQKKTGLWGYFNDPERPSVHDLEQKMMKFDMLKSKDIHPEAFEKYDRQTRRAITPAGFAKAFFLANQ